MFRLYVDESGDHSYTLLDLPDRRYLCLVGCFFSLQRYEQAFRPELEALKVRHFRHDPDEPVILQRKDLINKKGPFRVLLDPDAEAAFNEDLLRLVRDADFKLIAVVIDKRTHIERYGDAAWHPYHYCLTALLERYCGYLNFTNARGDVLAESRGGSEDFQLKEAYKHIYGAGAYYRPAGWFQRALTSHDIKLKPKSKNVAGLQLADIIAHPVKQQILFERGQIGGVRSQFGQRLYEALQARFNRQAFTGEVWGYGKKFLA